MNAVTGLSGSGPLMLRSWLKQWLMGSSGRIAEGDRDAACHPNSFRDSAVIK